MKKRIRKKIIKAFHELDAGLLDALFWDDGWRNHEIKQMRRAIQYLKRRYRKLYREAFHCDDVIGHYNAR